MDSFKSKLHAHFQELGIDPPLHIVDIINQVSGTREKVLNISGHALDAKTLTALCNALVHDIHFQSLSITDSFLGDEGACILANTLKYNTTLKSVDLRGNNIRAEGAKALANMLKINNTLKSLLLEWNCIGIWDTGLTGFAEALSLNRSLEVLDLRKCKICPNGAKALAEGLKFNSHLKRLDLRWNQIGAIGGKSIAEALKNNLVICEIDLTGNDIPEDICLSINVLLTRNNERHRLSAYQHNLNYGYTHSSTSSAISTTVPYVFSSPAHIAPTILDPFLDAKIGSLSEMLLISTKENATLQDSLKNLNSKIKDLESEKQSFIFKYESALEEMKIQMEKNRDTQANDLNDSKKLIAQYKSKITELELLLEESQTRLQSVLKDKKGLQEELEVSKSNYKVQIDSLNAKIWNMEKNHEKNIILMKEGKNDEISDIHKKYEERIRAMDHEKSIVQEKLDDLKTRHAIEKRHLMDSISETENKMKKHEELLRFDLESQLLSVKHEREKIQDDLATQLTIYATYVQNHEMELRKLSSQRTMLNEQIGELKSTNIQCNSEIASLKSNNEQLKHTIRILEDKLLQMGSEYAVTKEDLFKEQNQHRIQIDNANMQSKQKDIIISRLKDEVHSLSSELSNEREEQAVRMKELTSQINSLLVHRKHQHDSRLRDLERSLAQ